MKKEIKTIVNENKGLTIILSVLLIFITVFIPLFMPPEVIQDRGIILFTFGILVLVIITSVIASIVLLYYYKGHLISVCSDNSNKFEKNCKECAQTTSDLVSVKEYLDLKLDSIINYKRLSEIEKNVDDGAKIQVLTSDFDLEENGTFREIIIDNMNRGINYTYFVPDTETAIDEFHDVVKEWRKNVPDIENKLTAYKVPNESAYMTILAYDVKRPKKTDIIIKFPSNKLYDPKDFPFHFRIPKESMLVKENFRVRLREMEKENRKIEL